MTSIPPTSAALPSLRSLELTVCFFDMAGFTALTEAHGDSRAADLAVQLTSLAHGAMGPTDVFVKSIGDAVLVTSPTPPAALALATRLFDAAAAVEGFPVLRAGLHHGPVVLRDGDIFGATVNLAARVAAHASGNQMVTTHEVAQAARVAGLGVQELGPIALKNVRDPVILFALVAAGASSAAVDPVCRMRVNPGSAPGSLRYGGAQYWFCSWKCLVDFTQSPTTHVAGFTDR